MPGIVALGPMAGVTDLPFRTLCKECGADLIDTEMVSAKGLVYGGRNTEDLLATTPLEGEKLEDGSNVTDHPLVVQIFGAEAEFMEQAVQILKHRGFEWFDVNMGRNASAGCLSASLAMYSRSSGIFLSPRAIEVIR